MKDSLTQIAVVLDRSGSMNSVRDATIEMFNEFIAGQKLAPGQANILLVQFDSEGPHEIVIDKPLAETPDLTPETFVPRAQTPLHDAMGWTINEVGRRLKAAPESERAGKVVFVVLTDGQENASREFNQKHISEMVKHQTDKYKWSFIFLGANQDAVLTARGYSITADSALTYNSNRKSMRPMAAALTRNVVQARAGKKVQFSHAERKLSRQ